MSSILHVGKRCISDYPMTFPANYEVEYLDISACSGAYAAAELINRSFIRLKKNKNGNPLIFLPLNLEPCRKNEWVLKQLEILVEIRINAYFFHHEKTEDSMIDAARIVVYAAQRMETFFRNYAVFGTVATPGTFFLQTDHQGIWDHRKLREFAETPMPAKNRLISAFKAQLLRELDPQIHNLRHGNANLFGAYIMLNILHQLQGRPFRLREDLLPSRLRQALFVYNRRLDNMELGEDRKMALTEIGTIKEQLSQHGYNIGLVDDEAQKFRLERAGQHYTSFGWAYVFNKILAGDAGPENTIMVDLLKSDGEKEDTAISLLKKFQVTQGGASQKTNKRVIRELALRIIRNIRDTRCCCLLLDVYLKSQKEPGNILDCSGAQLLAELRRIMPAFPIIVVTAINKPWKHRLLLELGADAVWIKEGLDEKRMPEDSVQNFVRLFELIRKMTGPEYQFLSRVGLQIHRLKKNPRLWWKNAYSFAHADSRHSLTNFRLQDPGGILRVLDGALLAIRRFLLDFHLNRLSPDVQSGELPQSLIDQEDYFVKSVIRDLSQIIEALHGKKFDPGYQLNSQDIGGRIQNTKQFIFGRGDWFGFGLYQHRNECSHYFPGFRYSFDDSDKNGRNLMYFLSHLLAYLSTEEEPYSSFEPEDLLQTKAPANSIIRPGYMNWLIHGKTLSPMVKKYQEKKRKMDRHREIYDHIRTGN